MSSGGKEPSEWTLTCWGSATEHVSGAGHGTAHATRSEGCVASKCLSATEKSASLPPDVPV